MTTSGTASTRRAVSIHGPGAGSHRKNAGTVMRTPWGSASPRPRAANNATATGALAVKANANAAPMYGAMHADAMSVTKTPSPNAPAVPATRASGCGTGTVNSTRPDIASASTSSSTAMNPTNTGDCSWKPQPTALPAPRATSKIPPSAVQLAMTPAT